MRTLIASRFCGHGLLMLLAAVLFTGLALRAQQDPSRGYPPVLPKAKTEVYKTAGDVKLNMYIYYPAGHQPSDHRPVAVFFFGGGWNSGSPAQFAPQAEYLASRGMVAMLADYRVASRHGVKAIACVEDAKSAIRWVRQNAARLGVDPGRVVASGGSAGGHLAAATATIAEFDAPGEDRSISSVPNAMALFNPALVMAPVDGKLALDTARAKELPERVGADPRRISPYHHVQKGTPPAIVFHGKNDTTVPYRTAELFCERMQAAGNRCELVGYDGQGHGFFNYQRGGKKPYYDTLRRMDQFLASLGYLKGEPTVQER